MCDVQSTQLNYTTTNNQRNTNLQHLGKARYARAVGAIVQLLEPLGNSPTFAPFPAESAGHEGVEVWQWQEVQGTAKLNRKRM